MQPTIDVAAPMGAVLRTWLVSLCSCLALGSGITHAASASKAKGPQNYLSRADVRSFLMDLHTEHGLDIAEMERVLGAARHQAIIVRLIGPERKASGPAPVRSYPRYRAKFLTPARINAGVQYWQAHARDLERAEVEFGVPAEVILGILGVETAFGTNTGSFRIVDALATIAFDGPRRRDYFREELKQLFLLAHETRIDPLTIKGSYAGAMGLPQFMPSSYRRLAVDFDRDGRTDLLGSPADAIGSVASYLNAHGWVMGETASVRVQLPAGTASELVSGLKWDHTVAGLEKVGVTFPGASLPESAVSIIELPKPGASPQYLAAFRNFEAVTRYNRSTFYATAVLELADAIRAARERFVAGNDQTPANPAS